MNTLPEGWRLVRLGDVAETALGKMLDAARPKGELRVPYLRNVNVQWGRVDTADVHEVPLSADEHSRFELITGDLLVCEGGEIGRAAVWRGSGRYMAYQKALHRVRSTGELDLSYLRYLLEYYAHTGELSSRATGSTILHLPQRALRALPLPLPHLPEQRRIVELLEDHLSRLDAADSYLCRACARLRTFERSALEQSFGAGADLVPLDSLVADIAAGKSFGSASTPAGEGEWGIIKVSAMTWGEFKSGENKAVTGTRVDPRFEIHEGDLLLSRANTSDYVGASVLVGPVRPRLLLSDKSLRVTPRDGVLAEWLWRALQTPSARRQISTLATGTKESMRNISQASLRRVMLPSVGMSAQETALADFGHVKTAADALRRQLDSRSRQLAALRHSLLAAAFSGRLTGTSNSAADELVYA